MSDSIEPLTAKAKLANSRAVLLGAMGFEEISNEANGELTLAARREPLRHSAVPAISTSISKSAVGRWWHRSPLSSLVQLSQPFLDDFANRNPGKLIAYGAGAGAVLWVAKPWKLISAATVLTLISQGLDVSGVVSALLSKTSSAGHMAPPPMV